VFGFAIICPITRQQKGYPFEVELPDDVFRSDTYVFVEGEKMNFSQSASKDLVDITLRPMAIIAPSEPLHTQLRTHGMPPPEYPISTFTTSCGQVLEVAMPLHALQ
jgi:hypothetical protein